MNWPVLLSRAIPDGWAGAAELSRRARATLAVFKPRIALEIMLTALAGAAVASGPKLSTAAWTALAAAVFVAAGAAGAYNQWIERDIDARMSRTRARPFVTGALRASRGWLWAIGLLLVAAILLSALVLNALAALMVLLGALTYAVVYTNWLKRRTWLNIVVGGLAGSFAALAGAAAVDAGIGMRGWLLAAALFFWTPTHFWSLAYYRRRDYERAGVPMLPSLLPARTLAWIVLLHTLLVVGLTLAPPMTALGPVYLVCAAVGGAWFIATSVRFVRSPSGHTALRNFHGSLIQLGLLLLGAIGSGAAAGKFG